LSDVVGKQLRQFDNESYGIVVVTGGPCKGRIGEYDDDEGDRAIVYNGL
jgi:hypothetical protein